MLLSKLSFYPEPDSHFRDKVKALLDLSSYATKKEVEHVTGVDTLALAMKNDFVVLKAEGDKLDINKLVNESLKTKIKKNVKTVLEKLSNLVENEVVLHAH